MKIIIALTILISLPSFAADHHYEKNVSDGSIIEFKLDENMEMSGKAKERMMNNPNYLMNRKECKEVKDGVAGLLLMSDGIWEEIKKGPEDKDKWAEVMALSSLASNYSNIYDVWCKGLTHHGIKKMKIKALHELILHNIELNEYEFDHIMYQCKEIMQKLQNRDLT